MRALVSLSNKKDIEGFAKTLQNSGVEIISTGNTAKILSKSGLEVTEVSEITSSPEMLDGRVKTLHPKIHGGILARRDLDHHVEQVRENDISLIDIVVVNLYPFVDTIMSPNSTMEDALENIDIGGPTLIRAAAKNFPWVLVVVDPEDYSWIQNRFENSGEITYEERKLLARKAFQHVALYDTAVARYLGDSPGEFTSEVTFGYELSGKLRYGENPHQSAAVYLDPLNNGGIVRAEQISGPEISFNNLLDAESAWNIVQDYDESAVTVVKHNNPCGLAVHEDQPKAYLSAYHGDTMSAYGGIVAFNRKLTEATARAMSGVFYHVVIAPAFDTGALEVLKKRKQARILRVDPVQGPGTQLDIRKISGGLLVQDTESLSLNSNSWETKSKRDPNEQEIRDMMFAWQAAKHVKSNSIVLAKDNALIGMGAGQPNRVTSVHLALKIAGDRSQGTVLASDAFFPFADGIELAASGGVTAVIEPGGSVRDADIIETADRLNLALIFTGHRHFRH